MSKDKYIKMREFDITPNAKVQMFEGDNYKPNMFINPFKLSDKAIEELVVSWGFDDVNDYETHCEKLKSLARDVSTMMAVVEDIYEWKSKEPTKEKLLVIIKKYERQE